MLIKIGNSSDFKDCDVTDPEVYLARRNFVRTSVKYLAGGVLANYGFLINLSHASLDFSAIKKSAFFNQ